MATIIDGKKISAEIRAEIAEEVKTMKESGVCPGLAVIIVGENRQLSAFNQLDFYINTFHLFHL